MSSEQKIAEIIHIYARICFSFPLDFIPFMDKWILESVSDSLFWFQIKWSNKREIFNVMFVYESVKNLCLFLTFLWLQVYMAQISFESIINGFILECVLWYCLLTFIYLLVQICIREFMRITRQNERACFDIFFSLYWFTDLIWTRTNVVLNKRKY
jgi:hypothetical protein